MTSITVDGGNSLLTPAAATSRPRRRIALHDGDNYVFAMSATPRSVLGKPSSSHLNAIAYVAMALIVVGLAAALIHPDPLTGALFPSGIGLWWLVGYLARRRDRRA